jgi:hypothetical protein
VISTSTALYLTKHNILKRKISTPSMEFEPIIEASERPQIHALDGATTGVDRCTYTPLKDILFWKPLNPNF